MAPILAPLPDQARLWLFAFDRPLADLRPQVEAALDQALGNWRHKGQAYEAAWEILEDRLLALAEPHMAQNPSGCAIDGMLRKVQRIAAEAGLALVDEQSVLVRRPEGLMAHPKTTLGDLLAQGQLHGHTPVLDLALFNLGQLREGQLEKPLAETWIGRKYRVEA